MSVIEFQIPREWSHPQWQGLPTPIIIIKIISCWHNHSLAKSRESFTETIFWDDWILYLADKTDQHSGEWWPLEDKLWDLTSNSSRYLGCEQSQERKQRFKSGDSHRLKLFEHGFRVGWMSPYHLCYFAARPHIRTKSRQRIPARILGKPFLLLGKCIRKNYITLCTRNSRKSSVENRVG